MELKTNITAEDNKQELFITRDFDLPVALLFKAYTEPELVEQWMGTRVLKLENHQHGGWIFETTDPNGNPHVFHGVIHEFTPESSIIRTFEMKDTSFPVQLEFFRFEPLTETTSRLTMHVVYQSAAVRDRLLQQPFAKGINMAHNRLESIVKQLQAPQS